MTASSMRTERSSSGSGTSNGRLTKTRSLSLMRAAIQEIVNKRPHWVFFLALSAFYSSFTPGTIKGMGYNLENIIAADQVATNLVNLALRSEEHTSELQSLRHLV